MAATTIKGKQKVCSHRSRTLEKGERSKHRGRRRGACECTRMHEMGERGKEERGERRERKEIEGQKDTEKRE